MRPFPPAVQRQDVRPIGVRLHTRREDEAVRDSVVMNHAAAQAIAGTLVSDGSRGRGRHLLRGRRSRMEAIAGKRLDEPQALREFLADFLYGAEAYFSYLRLSPFHDISTNIDSLAARRIEGLIEQVKRAVPPDTRARFGFALTLHLAGAAMGNHPITEKTYLYATKNGCTLVLAMAISGSLVPRGVGDVWNLTFDIGGITFLDFETTTDFIRETMLTNERLIRYNSLLSFVFTVFSEQVSERADHRLEEELDREALEGLSDDETKLLGIYMPIFDRYGEADERVLDACEAASAAFARAYPAEHEWIMSSPSYSLPAWFIRFVFSLAPGDRAFLESLDPNRWSDDEINHMVTMVSGWRTGQQRHAADGASRRR